jgi:RNA polymerase sigma-70 factor (ECF subfamily)
MGHPPPGAAPARGGSLGEGAREDERALVAALQAGDEAAYERLVRSHAGRMLRVARRLLADEEDARDAVQEAFGAVFRSIGSFAGEARLATWMHRIVVNAALMKLRSRRRRPEEPIDPLLPAFDWDGHRVTPAGSAAAAAAGSAPDAAAERNELRQLVQSAIDRLPERYRTVLVLRDIEDLDTGEVAELLGVGTGVVKTRLHRARQALRTLLDPELRANRT